MKQKPTNTAGRFLKKFKFFLILAAVGLPLFFWYWIGLPVDPGNSTVQVFSIPSGQATRVIGNRLKQAGLIRSSLAFRLLVEGKDLSGKLQAGDFRLRPGMNLNTIVEELTHGSQDFWITFPEGMRTEEYARLLAEKSAIDEQAFILAAKPYEGRLFPDTYLIPTETSAGEVVAILTDNFDRKSPVRDDQTVILASLIEREAKHEQDRKLVSSVIHNRLAVGMPLQIDATVQYLLGRPGDWWPKHLTRDDLQTNSVYNTYLNTGLPPAPIANPGLASLKAAANPAETDYLYYVSDSGGYNHYAVTLDEHHRNIDQYLTP